jgi:hypothetical protein
MRLIFLLWLALISTRALADLPGSQDLELLPRLAGSEIVTFKTQAKLDRIYPQGAIGRISGRLRYEREVMAQGSLTAITYELPATHSASDAFTVSREWLQQRGAQLLYWCQGRECGSSNLWANEVFATSMLYGGDDQQSYALLRLAQPQPDRLLALYAITRGNRRAYLHVEQLLVEAPLAQLLPTPATLARQLKNRGYLELPAEATPTGQWLEVLARSLNIDTTLQVRLSCADAALWREALIGQQVRASRLNVVPGCSDALRVEVVR